VQRRLTQPLTTFHIVVVQDTIYGFRVDMRDGELDVLFY